MPADRPRAALPIEEADEPLRAVKLAEVRGRSAPRVHPSGRYWRRAYDHLEPARATCHRRRHDAPHLDCSCGFHAVADEHALERAVKVFADSVVLEVELSAVVIEHERGYRAEQQHVMGVRFPAACSWCGDQAVRVVPGRLWRSACTTCASGRVSLSRPDATARLGVDVAFTAMTAEPPKWRAMGGLRAGLMAVLVALCLLAARHERLGAVTVTGLLVCSIVATSLAVVTLCSRSARPHGDLFLLQCWCLVVASAVVALGAV